MRAFSSVASITVHIGLGAAVLLSQTRSARSNPTPPRADTIFFQPVVTHEDHGQGVGLPLPVAVGPQDFRSIPIPVVPQTGATMPTFSPSCAGAAAISGTDQTRDLGGLLTEEHADVLSGPLPVYPDLLRQAGIQGRVVLEAVVDTTGRVLPPSISVVSATNPGFVAPARQALLATLFRPAMVGGNAVRMRVRIPYEFAIRNGTGRAR